MTERTVVLDLDTATAEGQANRSAFEDMFAVGGVSVDGGTAKVVVPDLSNLPQFLAAWSVMSDRIDADGFIVDANYTDSSRSDSLGARVSGTGLEGTRSSTTRQLTAATLYDNRNGGAEVALATCQAP